MAEVPEIQFARRLMQGDLSAFDDFVSAFRTKLYRFSYLACGQREDAEEVAQETLLKVFASFDQLRDAALVRPWVFRIAKNFCLMRRRRSQFAPASEVSLDEVNDGRRTAEIPDPSEAPEALAIRSELRASLENAIRQLPEIYQSVVLLRDVEGLSTEEAGEVLEVSSDVVKQRLRRARLALRELLQREHDGPLVRSFG